MKARPRVQGMQRVLLAAILALAFYLVIAGASEVMLARDAACRAKIARLNLAPDPDAFCMQAWQTLIMRAASRGLTLIIYPDISPVLAWCLMGLLFTSLGAILSRASTVWGVLGFLGFFFALSALIAGMVYMSRYIIWPWAPGGP